MHYSDVCLYLILKIKGLDNFKLIFNFKNIKNL